MGEGVAALGAVQDGGAVLTYSGCIAQQSGHNEGDVASKHPVVHLGVLWVAHHSH